MGLGAVVGLGVDLVVPGTAVAPVVAVAAVQVVVRTVAVEIVVASTSVDRIVAVTGMDGVVPPASNDVVGARSPADDVAMPAAMHRARRPGSHDDRGQMSSAGDRRGGCPARRRSCGSGYGERDQEQRTGCRNVLPLHRVRPPW
jgi:hypothetical protein